MKVKKSLLIVPAMATMLLAAAGSVGGTVAWFSATTTFDITASTFKVVRLEGDLACTLVGGTGTNVSAATTISVNANSELTHGSFNHTDGKVYVTTNAAGTAFRNMATVAADGGAVTGDLQAGTYTDSSSNPHTVYYAVTWKMNFTYSLPAGASAGDYMNLYFDLANSNMDATQGSGSHLVHTSTGLRIAFYPNTASSVTTVGNLSSPKVWAGLQTNANCKYVSSTSATSTYATGTLLDSANSHVIAEGDAGTGSEDICLGQFNTFNSSGQSLLGFTCVAWFEGTDPGVITASTMDQVATALAFYTRVDDMVVTP